jgi:predicted permease
LLLGAGLLIKSFAKLVRTDVGYDPINVVTFQIPQPELSFPADVPKQVQRNIFNHEVVRRLAFIPGVEAAAFTNVLPMVQMSLTLGVSSAGYSSVREADYDTVSPDYFRVMKLQVMQGRDLDSSDRTGSRPAYVVNETLSRMLFPNASAVGQTITIGPRMAPGEIVGVVRDARQWGLDAQPRPCLFVDPEHTIGVVGTTQGGVYYTFRTKRKVNAVVPQIRKVVSDLDSNLVVDNVATMDQIISNSITAPRSYAALLGAFSVAALGLVTIGIFGLLAYLVKQRRQEIGIRLALGSEGWRILMLVLRQGLSLGILGLTIGLAGGVALTRYLGNMLFGVAPLDWPTFMIIAALVMVATGLASYLPARQAVAVDPVVTLRCD